MYWLQGSIELIVLVDGFCVYSLVNLVCVSQEGFNSTWSGEEVLLKDQKSKISNLATVHFIVPIDQIIWCVNYRESHGGWLLLDKERSGLGTASGD